MSNGRGALLDNTPSPPEGDKLDRDAHPGVPAGLGSGCPQQLPAH